MPVWCAGKFAQNDELLTGLVKLGLKSSISWSAILDAAHGLEASPAQDFSARQRATALLSQLDKLAQKGVAGGDVPGPHLRTSQELACLVDA